MSHRRALLSTLGAAAVAGCLDTTPGRRRQTTRTGTPTDRHTTAATDTSEGTPETSSPTDAPDDSDLPAWTPSWQRSLAPFRALGVAAGGDDLYLLLGDGDGRGAVAAVARRDGTLRWRRRLAGEPSTGAAATGTGIARGQWDVTVTDETVLVVAEPSPPRGWTAVTAHDRATGERRWRLRRDRELGVAGVTDGLAVLLAVDSLTPGTPRTVHDTPSEPLPAAALGVARDTGRVRWRRSFAGVVDLAVDDEAVLIAAADGVTALDHAGNRTFRYPRRPARQVVTGGGRVWYGTGPEEAGTVHVLARNGGVVGRAAAPTAEFRFVSGRLYAGGGGLTVVSPDASVWWRTDGHDQWLSVGPAGDRLYTRAGGAADELAAYDLTDGLAWRFVPPSNDAWPEAAGTESVVASAITAGGADDPFLTTYRLTADGRPVAARGLDTVFDATGVGDTVYLADGAGRLWAV